MANARAIANGNWSSTSTWNGGVLPGNGDTVYANGFNITLDTDITIGGANNPIVNTGSLVSGQWYEIVNVGGQNWTGIGAASNTVGTIFQASAAGTAGNLGTARALATITTATNTAAGATIGGGVFTMSTVRSINCDLRAGTTTCLNVTATTGTAVFSNCRVIGGSATGAHGVSTTANSDIGNCTFTGGSAAGSFAFNNTASATMNISAPCVFNSGGGTSAYTINHSSTGSININASCTLNGAGNGAIVLFNSSASGVINVNASCAFAGGGSAPVCLNNTTGTINITAACTFTGQGSSNNAVLVNNGLGSLNVTAPCTFTASTGPALSNVSTGTMIVERSTFIASQFSNAVSITSTSADVRLSGDFLDHWSGWKAVTGGKWRLGVAPTAARTRYALAGTVDSYVEMYTADNAGFGLPAANHVRSGISYGGGAVTGTCAVPAAGAVALGVPVDNTTGTAILTQADVQSALTAQGLTTARAGNLDNLDATVSSRLAPSGTLSRVTLTDTATTLTNAPASVTPADIWSHSSRTLTSASGPTAVQIRQEIDANSTKLDASISSRLAAADYNAPTSAPTAASVANAVWSAAARTITGGTVDTLTNAPTVPSAAAIATQVWAVADKTGYSLTSAERSAIAAAVEASLLNEGDGQAILNAIVTAIGNSNVDQVALVAAIRSDLERNGGKLDGVPAAVRSNLATELGRIDAEISTRLASSAYTAPANSDITAIKAKTDALPASPAATGDIPSANIAAIKAKTDLLNTDRLAQCSTVSTTGAQLAAALS